MKKSTWITGIVIGLYIISYIIVTAKQMNGYILRLQGFIDIPILTVMFWLLVFWICYKAIIGDTGFMKIGAVLAATCGVFLLLFLFVSNERDYDLISSDDYELVVEIIHADNSKRVSVFKKEGLFFSKYVDYVVVSNNYELFYEIDGSTFKVSKCLDETCDIEEISLNTN